MDDARTVTVKFETIGDMTKITETFDPETENSEEMQRTGWQVHAALAQHIPLGSQQFDQVIHALD